MQLALQELPNGPTFVHPEDDETNADIGAIRRDDLVDRWSHTALYVGED